MNTTVTTLEIIRRLIFSADGKWTVGEPSIRLVTGLPSGVTLGDEKRCRVG
jgi:hypothetical protein